MIAIAHSVSRTSPSTVQEMFLAMLPAIRARAHLAFRADNPEAREEFMAEVVANAFCAFRRLAERGKLEVAHATPLAKFAIRQIRCGRLTGAQLNVRDITSRHAQLAKGIKVERLDQFDREDGTWRETLVEDKKAGPAETAAARIDVADWFRSLTRQKRKIAKTLARGEATSKVARMFGLSAGRISQVRDELRRSWLEFQAEPAFA
jgi:hypothetical protein